MNVCMWHCRHPDVLPHFLNGIPSVCKSEPRVILIPKLRQRTVTITTMNIPTSLYFWHDHMFPPADRAAGFHRLIRISSPLHTPTTGLSLLALRHCYIWHGCKVLVRQIIYILYISLFISDISFKRGSPNFLHQWLVLYKINFRSK